MRALTLAMGAWLAVVAICQGQDVSAPIPDAGSEQYRVTIQELEYSDPTREYREPDMERRSLGFVYRQITANKAMRHEEAHFLRARETAREVARTELRIHHGRPTVFESQEADSLFSVELPPSLNWRNVRISGLVEIQCSADGRVQVQLSYNRTGIGSHIQVREGDFQLSDQAALRIVTDSEVIPGRAQIVHIEPPALENGYFGTALVVSVERVPDRPKEQAESRPSVPMPLDLAADFDQLASSDLGNPGLFDESGPGISPPVENDSPPIPREIAAMLDSQSDASEQLLPIIEGCSAMGINIEFAELGQQVFRGEQELMQQTQLQQTPAHHVPVLFYLAEPPQLHFEAAEGSTSIGIVQLGLPEPGLLPMVEELLDANPIPLPPVASPALLVLDQPIAGFSESGLLRMADPQSAILVEFSTSVKEPGPISLLPAFYAIQELPHLHFEAADASNSIGIVHLGPPEPAILLDGEEEFVEEEFLGYSSLSPEPVPATKPDSPKASPQQFQLNVVSLDLDLARLRSMGVGLQGMIELHRAGNQHYANVFRQPQLVDSEMFSTFASAALKVGLARVIADQKVIVSDGRHGEYWDGTLIKRPQPDAQGKLVLTEERAGLQLMSIVRSLDEEQVEIEFHYKHSAATKPEVLVDGVAIPGMAIRSILSTAKIPLGQTWLAGVLPAIRDGAETVWILAVTPQLVADSPQATVNVSAPGFYAAHEPPQLHFETADASTSIGIVHLGPPEPALLQAQGEVLAAEPIPMPPALDVAGDSVGSVRITGFSATPEAVKAERNVQLPLPPLTVNLNDERMNRYLRVSIILQSEAAALNQGKLAPALAGRELEIRDALVAALSDKTVEDVRGRTGIERVREEVLTLVNRILAPDGAPAVTRVLFTEFAVQ